MDGNETSTEDAGLRFVMNDGAMIATFSPQLSSVQYEELYTRSEAPSTTAGLCQMLETAAKEWGIKVSCVGATP